MNGHKTHSSGLLPFRVIESAASGDVDAINKILRHALVEQRGDRCEPLDDFVVAVFCHVCMPPRIVFD